MGIMTNGVAVDENDKTSAVIIEHLEEGVPQKLGITLIATFSILSLISGSQALTVLFMMALDIIWAQNSKKWAIRTQLKTSLTLCGYEGNRG